MEKLGKSVPRAKTTGDRKPMILNGFWILNSHSFKLFKVKHAVRFRALLIM